MVEQSQQNDMREFWPTVDLTHAEHLLRRKEWRFNYKHYWLHSSRSGKTPAELRRECGAITPLPPQDLEDSCDAQKGSQPVQH